MEVLETQPQEQVNPSSPTEDDGGVAAPAPAPAANPATPAPAEKSQLEKLREKAAAGVAPPAVKDPAAAAVIPNPFKPNFRFKAAGKELDVPEMLRGVMKDPESEKYLHSLLSKAHGIEMIQDKLKGAREARDQAHNAYIQMRQPIEMAQEAYKRGDLDTVFETLRVDRNKVLQWAYRQVELSQMPPDQRQVHEARTQAERRNWELERQAQAQMQQGQSTMGEQINQMLELVLERQDVAPIAQAYDTKQGKEGSFRSLVTDMGELEFNRTGKVISPLEAAKKAVELLGEKFGAQAPAQPAPAAAPPPAQTAQPAAADPKPRVTLPNAGGSKTAAPAKGKVKSLEDIRKLHQQMASS